MQLENTGIRRVAVSVLNGDQEYCNRAYAVIRRRLGYDVDVIFFDANSRGCWIH